MGHINRQHGRIAIETKGGVGFIIHAGYGMRLERRQVGELKPGTIFFAPDPRRGDAAGGGPPVDNPPEQFTWRVHAVYEDKVEATEEQFSTIADFRPGREVEVANTEVFDETLPLARSWNGSESNGHPEFLAEDIDDLIAALQEAKGKL